MASEATSLGCHTDLWAPARGTFSSMVETLGLRRLFAPLRGAGETLGPILPDVARETGLDPATPVICGIHDSNASLLPHLKRREPPFAVVSTGTWVIVMAIGGEPVILDPARDTLINVNALGLPVPSARFMGGREYELTTGGNARAATEADIDAALGQQVLLLPSVQQGSGPFADRAAAWRPQKPEAPGVLAAAASFYLAMMTATCLELSGAAGPIVVEGPFAANEAFTQMLAAATGRPVIAESGAVTGTSVGAALLASDRALPPAVAASGDGGVRPAMIEYARAWRAATSSAG
jgi:sugar (pentulose or hexulose) kinase